MRMLMPSHDVVRDDEISLRNRMVRIMQQVATQGLARSSDGNLSARLTSKRYLITPSGIYKPDLEADDLIVIDENGQVVAGRPGLQPTSEIALHLEVYQRRPEIGAVLHAHPPCATALTIVGIPFPMDFIPEAWLGLGEVVIAPYATPGTRELALSVREAIRHSNVVLLSHHGSLTIGRTLPETLMLLERVEHTARTYLLAQAVGQPQPLPAERLAELRRLREQTAAPEAAAGSSASSNL